MPIQAGQDQVSLVRVKVRPPSAFCSSFLCAGVGGKVWDLISGYERRLTRIIFLVQTNESVSMKICMKYWETCNVDEELGSLGISGLYAELLCG